MGPEKIMETAQWMSNHPISKRTIVNNQPKIGRNDPCPCGSGKKYKNCCLLQVRALEASRSVSELTKKDIIKSGKYLRKKFDKIRAEIEKNKIEKAKAIAAEFISLGGQGKREDKDNA